MKTMSLLLVFASLALAHTLVLEGHQVQRISSDKQGGRKELTVTLDSKGNQEMKSQLHKPTDALAEPSGNIPKVIHHTFKDYPAGGLQAGFPEVYFNVSYFSFRNLFTRPEYMYMFHTDRNLHECIEQEFPEFLKEFESLERIEKSDAGRYCVLWKHGGIYADLDFEATRNFYDEIPTGQVSLNGSPYTENAKAAVQLQNALMASPRQHPFWHMVFKQMSKAGSHMWNEITGTGPAMISLMATQNPEQVHELPCQHFQRLGKCGNPSDFSEVYAVHWNVNSYAVGAPGVLNIKLRMDKEWRHWHPDLPFPSAPQEGVADSTTSDVADSTTSEAVHGESSTGQAAMVLWIGCICSGVLGTIFIVITKVLGQRGSNK